MLIRIDCAPGFAPPSSGSPDVGGGGPGGRWLEWGVVEFQGELVGLDLQQSGAGEQDVGEIIDVKVEVSKIAHCIYLN